MVYHYGIGRHIWDIPLSVNGVWDRNVGILPIFPIASTMVVQGSNLQAFVHRRHDIFVGNIFREDGNLAALQTSVTSIYITYKLSGLMTDIHKIYSRSIEGSTWLSTS